MKKAAVTDLGCVRAPWSTSAAWEMHWERMLLSSWLTAGWLQIWNRIAY